jgi:hypothetical protein
VAIPDSINISLGYQIWLGDAQVVASLWVVACERANVIAPLGLGISGPQLLALKRFGDAGELLPRVKYEAVWSAWTIALYWRGGDDECLAVLYGSDVGHYGIVVLEEQVRGGYAELRQYSLNIRFL